MAGTAILIVVVGVIIVGSLLLFRQSQRSGPMQSDEQTDVKPPLDDKDSD